MAALLAAGLALGFSPARAEVGLEAEATRLAALVPPALPFGDGEALPPVLSTADRERYRLIFALQEDGEWKRADAEIARLEDRVLIGHVLAQRYLHPTKYRSTYQELREWLGHYADHPDARRLHKLATQRRPKNAAPPKRPVGSYLFGSGHDGDLIEAKTYNPTKSLNAADRRKMRANERTIRNHLRRGATLAAKRMLEDKGVKSLFHPVQLDRLLAMQGAAYFGHGRDAWAIEWAGQAAARSGQYLPEAHWTVGLASWRLGRFEAAAENFAKAAVSEYASPWLRSGAGFWAARAYLRIRRPDEVPRWLGVAAAHPRTFYGLLAKHMLGQEPNFDWTLPPLAVQADADADATILPTIRRALALIEVGRDHQAERELRNRYGDADGGDLLAILGLSARTNMPSLAMRLGNLLARQGGNRFDAATYPLPGWRPAQGFDIDRALVYAIMRQESGFNPEARSPAGARGLMQIMPATASFIARDRSLRQANANALYDPEFNLALGQRYISMLLSERHIDNDLFKLIASWNGGPGNVNRWLREIKHGGDPLLFIESIPARETRMFIERVLANLWIYRNRMGQPTPSLAAIAEGRWPVYIPLDAAPLRLARD